MFNIRFMFSFKCSSCGKPAHSKYEGIDKCQSCRSTTKVDYKQCAACHKAFYSTIGKEYCRSCFAIRGDYSGNYIKNRTSALRKSQCLDIRLFKKEIYLLATKSKWGLLSYIDIFRIASIYVAVTCDDNKYSQYEPEYQAKFMMDDLVRMVDGTIEIGSPGRPGRGVVKVDANGKVLKEYSSVTAAAEDNDIYVMFVRRCCNESNFKGLGRNRLLSFRWKKDINI